MYLPACQHLSIPQTSLAFLRMVDLQLNCQLSQTPCHSDPSYLRVRCRHPMGPRLSAFKLSLQHLLNEVFCPYVSASQNELRHPTFLTLFSRFRSFLWQPSTLCHQLLRTDLLTFFLQFSCRGCGFGPLPCEAFGTHQSGGCHNS